MTSRYYSLYTSLLRQQKKGGEAGGGGLRALHLASGAEAVEVEEEAVPLEVVLLEVVLLEASWAVKNHFSLKGWVGSPPVQVI